ncbi:MULTISPECIES: hypothetical protein [unclassified Geodermatophilus]
MSDPSRPRPGAVVGLGAVLGALCWIAWLGWDRSASYDVVTESVQTPYVTLQVLGCALTVGIVTAVLAARTSSLHAAAGVSLGFWLLWTVDAASQDDSGLFAVGSVMLACGLAAGTALAAGLGSSLRALWLRARRRRGRGR